MPAVAVIGNAGSGKSTVLNTLIGEPLFKSGVSFTTGLTIELQKQTHGGRDFYDTPGLADPTMGGKAAAEIGKLFESAIPLSIVFVVTLSSGRVEQKDALAINSVLDALAIPDMDNRFTILINKIPKTTYDVLKNDAEKLRLVVECLSTRYQTHHIKLLAKDDAAEDAPNVMLDPSVVSSELADVPHVRVDPERVKPIDYQSLS